MSKSHEIFAVGSKVGLRCRIEGCVWVLNFVENPSIRMVSHEYKAHLESEHPERAVVHTKPAIPSIAQLRELQKYEHEERHTEYIEHVRAALFPWCKFCQEERV